MKSAVKRGNRFTLVQLSIVGIVVITSSGAATTQAFGSGWSLNSSLSERMEFNDNVDMSPTAAKSIYGSTTSLNTNLAWRGRSRALKLNSSFDLRRVFGHGSRSELNTFNQFYKVDYSVKRKTTNFEYSASYRSQDATSSELEDTGIFTRIDNNRLTSTFSAKATHDVNRRLKVRFSSSITSVDFEKSSANVTRSMSINLNSSLIRKLTARTTATVSIGATFYDADNASDTRNNTYRFTGELATKFSPRLSARMKAGVVLSDSSRDATATTVASSETSLGALFDVGVDYRVKNTKLSFAASNNVSPDSLGDLKKSTRIRFDVAHRINNRSSINFAASATRGDNGNSFNLSPTYSYKFTKKWSANIGYTYARQRSTGPASSSNKVYVSITRTFSHLP